MVDKSQKNEDRSKFMGDNSMDDFGLKDHHTSTRGREIKSTEGLNLPDIRTRNSLLQSINANPDPDQDLTDKHSEGKKENTKVDIFNSREVSKHILHKCNIVRERNKKIPVLRSGEGKLMNMSETNVRNMYSKIFH